MKSRLANGLVLGFVLAVSSTWAGPGDRPTSHRNEKHEGGANHGARMLLEGKPIACKSNSVESQNNLKSIDDACDAIPNKKADELVRSPAFRKAARNAWRATWNGTARYETGFSIDESGRPGVLRISESDENLDAYDRLNHLRLVIRPDALGTFHIHNNYGNPRPSSLDINIAKTTHTTVYVGSRDGLYSVDLNGNVRHLFSAPNWFDKM